MTDYSPINLVPSAELLTFIRATHPRQIAEELVSVQPMPNIDWVALEQSWLWQSYCARHYGGDTNETS